MGDVTGIAWTDHTWSPWEGCAKVSPGCAHCYADTLNHRWNHDNWGFMPDGSRKPLLERSDAYWQKPIQWNKQAAQDGVRRRVFPSMCDPFDDAAPLELQQRFWDLIDATPHLDWLLLTKRLENIFDIVKHICGGNYNFTFKNTPNVWLGVSAEDQKRLDERAPILLGFDAKVRFLSLEPLIAPVDVFSVVTPRFAADDPRHEPWRNGVEWLIVGGESGHGARAMQSDWVDDIIETTRNASDAAIFVKQTGVVLARELGLKHSKGEDPQEWYPRWKIQEFPEVKL
jgi:protein gp37